MSLHGTFSHTLLNRPIWTALEPVLRASDTRLQRSESHDHDFSLRLASDPQPLHVLLLTPSSLETNKQETISRLGQFSASVSSASSRNAIAFVLSEDSFTRASGKYDLDGLLALQITLIESLPISIPIIPVPDVSCFLSSIQEYMTSSVDLPLPRPWPADSVKLLSHATASAAPHALSEHDTNILSDLFPSLQALSQAVRDPEGQAVIRDYLGDEETLEIAGFWDRDWAFE